MKKTLDIVAILDSVPDRFKNVVAIDIQTTADTIILTFKVVFFYSVLTKTCMINRDWQDNDITADMSMELGKLCDHIKDIELGGN